MELSSKFDYHCPMLNQFPEGFCRNNDFPSFQVMWDFDGFFRYSPMFYGYYSKKNERGGYNIPLAYFCAEMIVYIFRYAKTCTQQNEYEFSYINVFYCYKDMTFK